MNMTANITCKRMLSSVVRYNPVAWMKNLKGIPEYKLQLGMLNTPIHSWYEQLPNGFSVDIKRDDMTGSTLSGNKVRKLEFLMADAIMKGCRHVITCGGEQSNHCRAVAVAAAQLELKCHLFLRAHVQDPGHLDCSGNLFINRLCGAHMHPIPKFSKYIKDILPRMQQQEHSIREKSNERSYLIPVGGSDVVGLYGYIQAFAELEQQGVLENYDDLVFACGSGGTAAGLCIGNILTGSKLRLHGVTVSDDALYFHQHVNEMFEDVGMTGHKSEDNIDFIEGHKGKGYGLSTQEELEFIIKISSSSGILLDPVYTGKAAKGLFTELEERPDRFQGKRVLYIHTGGIFGLYDERINDLLRNRTSTSIS